MLSFYQGNTGDGDVSLTQQSRWYSCFVPQSQDVVSWKPPGRPSHRNSVGSQSWSSEVELGRMGTFLHPLSFLEGALAER